VLVQLPTTAAEVTSPDRAVIVTEQQSANSSTGRLGRLGNSISRVTARLDPHRQQQQQQQQQQPQPQQETERRLEQQRQLQQQQKQKQQQLQQLLQQQQQQETGRRPHGRKHDSKTSQL